ncbi:MAG: hypothetical protein AAB588_05625 [Patescibacteria group bacterium]
MDKGPVQSADSEGENLEVELASRSEDSLQREITRTQLQLNDLETEQLNMQCPKFSANSINPLQVIEIGQYHRASEQRALLGAKLARRIAKLTFALADVRSERYGAKSPSDGKVQISRAYELQYLRSDARYMDRMAYTFELRAKYYALIAADYEDSMVRMGSVLMAHDDLRADERLARAVAIAEQAMAEDPPSKKELN